MYREIEKYLSEWKESKHRKPLILRGARQVGKTYSVDKFAQENFSDYLKINIEQEQELHSIFTSRKPEVILNELSLIYNFTFREGECLLFIDEIQSCPEAIVSLGYFYKQNPDLHIIAAGSLLDHSLNEMSYSMPVGRVEFAYMYPMNFFEFLMANNKQGYVDYIKKYQIGEAISDALHKKISEYLRTYFFIGGMPEAVNYYVTENDLSGIEKYHANLISSIEYDFSKYGTRKEQEYLRDILRYTANNIGKKVKYTHVNRHAQSKHLKEAFLKLEMSRIIHLVRHTKASEVPLKQLENQDVFKPVFMDIGLLNHIAGIKLIGLDELVTAFEGSIAEQFALQEIISSAPPYQEQKLNYWLREAKNSNAEIDCLLQIKNQVIPLEIKAGKTGSLKSLHVFLAEKNKKTGIRLNMDTPTWGKDLKAKVNLKKKTEFHYNLISLPLYFAVQIQALKTERIF
ncbi:MAG: ATP-binding protein [Bacteroidota bacterium]